MAEENKLFRESALSHLSSADDLDNALKVSNPSISLSICAFLAAFVGLLVWLVTAVVPTATTTVAVIRDGKTATCWVDASLAEKLRASDVSVIIDDKDAQSISVGTRPLSSGEIERSLGSAYLSDGLRLHDWSYQVELTFSEDLYGAQMEMPALAPAGVVTAIDHPISLILSSGEAR